MLRMIAASAALIAVMTVSANAQDTKVNAGVLTCSVKGGTAFIIGSTKDLRCVFDKGGDKERYAGQIDKFGIDIGVTGQTVLVWTVLAPTTKVRPGALSGEYVGISADASIGVGGGANLLVGGSDRTISLQPLSAQAQTGLNAALTVASLKLGYVRGEEY